MNDKCACGCGMTPNVGKQFISGHNSKLGVRKPMVSKTCRFCGKTFEGTAAAIGNRIFCSKECRDEERRTLKGENNPNYKSFSMACEICGKTFITQPARIKNRQVYCSMECGREGRRRKISGKARSTRPYGNQKAKVRDAFVCRICGFDLIVHAHHIVPRKDGGTNHMSNIITLCPNHHAMAHAGLLSTDELVTAISTPFHAIENIKVRAAHAVNYRERPA